MSRTKSDGMSTWLYLILLLVGFMSIPAIIYLVIGSMTESWSFETEITTAFVTLVVLFAIGFVGSVYKK